MNSILWRYPQYLNDAENIHLCVAEMKSVEIYRNGLVNLETYNIYTGI